MFIPRSKLRDTLDTKYQSNNILWENINKSSVFMGLFVYNTALIGVFKNR